MPYTQEQKVQAVAVIKRFGGLTGEAIKAARDLLASPGLSGSTLHGWLRQYGDLVDRVSIRDSESSRIPKKMTVDQAATIVEDANEALDQIFEQTARSYLKHAAQPDVIAATKGKDAVIAAATAVDKMRLLRNLPTTIVKVLPALLDEMQDANIDATEFFQAALAKMRAARMNNADR